MGWGDSPGADFDNPYNQDDNEDAREKMANAPAPKTQQKQPQELLTVAKVKAILLRLRDTREGSVFDAYDGLFIDLFLRMRLVEKQNIELIQALRLVAAGGVASEEEPAEEPVTGAPGDKTPFPEGFSPGGPAAPAQEATEDDAEEEGIPRPDVVSGPPTNVAPIPKKAG